MIDVVYSFRNKINQKDIQFSAFSYTTGFTNQI